MLQLLLDAMFLSTWLGRGTDFGMPVLRGSVDPINYRLCAPPMLENCQAFYGGSALYLSILAPSGGSQWGAASGQGAAANPAPVAAESGVSTTNTVGLAPSMRRFALLPLPIDVSVGAEGGAGGREAEVEGGGLGGEEEGMAVGGGGGGLGFGFGGIRLKWG